MGITVENGGILTTVQDEGRFGNQAFGVSTSGAMDPRAFHIANLLVGNKKTEGALEMTFIGPTLTFTSDNIIAVTGGDLTPMLDGQPFPMYKAVLVKKGQKLMFAGAWLMMRGAVMFIYYGSFLPNGVWQSMGSGSKGIMYPYEIGSAMFWSGIAFNAIGIIIPFFKWLFKKVK